MIKETQILGRNVPLLNKIMKVAISYKMFSCSYRFRIEKVDRRIPPNTYFCIYDIYGSANMGKEGFSTGLKNV